MNIYDVLYQDTNRDDNKLQIRRVFAETTQSAVDKVRRELNEYQQVVTVALIVNKTDWD